MLLQEPMQKTIRTNYHSKISNLSSTQLVFTYTYVNFEQNGFIKSTPGTQLKQRNPLAQRRSLLAGPPGQEGALVLVSNAGCRRKLILCKQMCQNGSQSYDRELQHQRCEKLRVVYVVRLENKKCFLLCTLKKSL
jgi:hypothetical protein